MMYSQLLVLSLCFAFPGLREAQLLRRLVEDLARWPAGAAPESRSSRGSRQRPGGLAGPQQAVEPLLWARPKEDREDWKDRVHVGPTTPLRFGLPGPAEADHVAVRCGADSVQVEVSQHLLGPGRLVDPGEMTLGGCPATLADDSSEVLLFQSKLNGCKSKLVMTNDMLIYAFKLLFKPKPWTHVPIMRSMDAVVGVECHYPRVLPAG